MKGRMRLMKKACGFLLGLALVAALAIPVRANAATVTGRFVYRNGAPAADRQLHFENTITEDMYIAPTDSDGRYTVDLPPGVYDLRAERGVVLQPNVVVGRNEVNVRQAVEPAPLDFHRPFQHEGIADVIIMSPAPATANIYGRPLEGMKFGHEEVQKFWAPAKPLPPLPPPGTGEMVPGAQSPGSSKAIE
jgi:hypothetical protein